MAELSLVSLFAGAGGLDLGFAKAGFTTQWANEYDQTITPSYRSVFPDVLLDTRSICAIPDTDFPSSVTGVIGGPPCQSWSIAGAHRGIADKRGTLFFEYIRAIQHIKPRFFVAENVCGLVQTRHRETFQMILRCFEEMGYRVTWQIVNAHDYGVPQERKRVLIIGYHEALHKTFVFPKPLSYKPTLQDAIGDLAFIEPSCSSFIPNHECTESGYSSLFMSRNRVRAWHEPSFTILATDRHIPFHPKAPRMITVSPTQKGFRPGSESLYRRLSIRECARIQTFPDRYVFYYAHKRHGYRMIGNAVPVELAYWIACTIRDDMMGIA